MTTANLNLYEAAEYAALTSSDWKVDGSGLSKDGEVEPTTWMIGFFGRCFIHGSFFGSCATGISFPRRKGALKLPVEDYFGSCTIRTFLQKGKWF